MIIQEFVKRRDLAIAAAVEQGLLDWRESPLAAFIDVEGVAESVRSLRSAWPDSVSVRHTFAAKANCLVPVLRMLRANGMGCEVASRGELAQALAAGFQAEEIVFDSPAKTWFDLEEALQRGVAINIDNFQELGRVDEILGSCETTSRIGIRINPQIGIGAIAALSTASSTSKFGIPLRDEGSEARLVEAYLARHWLRWAHVHVGSQGCPLELIAQGVARTVAFAEMVNAEAGYRQIIGIDVGGGSTVDFEGDATPPGFEDHVRHLRAAAPILFSGGYQIVTEFGRSILAKQGFIAARVEYTKSAGGRPIAITHAGAHVAARTTLAPESWRLRVGVYDEKGAPKVGTLLEQDVVGPCCFAGDMLAEARMLPRLEPGDLITLLDTGAYYFSTPYRYNSLPDPPVYAFEIERNNTVRFSRLREAETVAAIVSQSGGGIPVSDHSRPLSRPARQTHLPAGYPKGNEIPGKTNAELVGSFLDIADITVSDEELVSLAENYAVLRAQADSLYLPELESETPAISFDPTAD